MTVFFTKNGRKCNADVQSDWANININQNESKALIVWDILKIDMLYWSRLDKEPI